MAALSLPSLSRPPWPPSLVWISFHSKSALFSSSPLPSSLPPLSSHFIVRFVWSATATALSSAPSSLLACRPLPLPAADGDGERTNERTNDVSLFTLHSGLLPRVALHHLPVRLCEFFQWTRVGKNPQSNPKNPNPQLRGVKILNPLSFRERIGNPPNCTQLLLKAYLTWRMEHFKRWTWNNMILSVQIEVQSYSPKFDRT